MDVLEIYVDISTYILWEIVYIYIDILVLS